MGHHSSHFIATDKDKTSTFAGSIEIDADLSFGDAITDSFTCSGLFKMGTSGTPLVLTAGTPTFTLYTTSSSTSGGTSVQPIYMKSTMTGAGGVGGRACFELSADVELGGWANALKGITSFGSSGGITGLASAVLAEMTLPDKDLGSGGVYCPLEIELTGGSSLDLSNGGPGGCYTAFAYMSANGTVTDIDDYGYLMSIQGLTAADGHLIDSNGPAAADIGIRINVGGTEYWLMASNTKT